MENIIYIILLLITILVFLLIFKMSLKKVKELKNNVKTQKITNKFPDDIEIANEMLEMLQNNDVKVEKAKEADSSLYIAISNKIVIADMKNNYSRIQTIAHECIHSCQDKSLLFFNFVFSNINILYFLIIVFLTIFKIINNTMLQIAILTLLSLIGFSIRSYLETDAMIKAKLLAKDYVEKKKICSKEEQIQLLDDYERINKIGIPFYIGTLLITRLSKVLMYTILAIFV